MEPKTSEKVRSILRPGANDRRRNMHNIFKKLLPIDYCVGIEQTRCKMFAQLTVAKYVIAKCRCVSKQVQTSRDKNDIKKENTGELQIIRGSQYFRRTIKWHCAVQIVVLINKAHTISTLNWYRRADIDIDGHENLRLNYLRRETLRMTIIRNIVCK